MTYTTPSTRLVDETTGVVINVGDTVPDFRGDPHVVKGWRAGSHPGSTGRVLVADPGYTFGEREFFPGVINARVVDEGQAWPEAEGCTSCGSLTGHWDGCPA